MAPPLDVNSIFATAPPPPAPPPAGSEKEERVQGSGAGEAALASGSPDATAGGPAEAGNAAPAVEMAGVSGEAETSEA